jgi:hypothetical protein
MAWDCKHVSECRYDTLGEAAVTGTEEMDPTDVVSKVFRHVLIRCVAFRSLGDLLALHVPFFFILTYHALNQPGGLVGVLLVGSSQILLIVAGSFAILLSFCFS